MTKGSTNYTWTRGRLLGSVAGVSDYTYDRNGRRIKKVVKNGNLYEYHNYYYDGDRLIAEKRGNKYLYFFYDESGVCGMRYNGENYEFVRNIFGDVLGIYNEDILVAAYAYDAWGNITQSVVLNDIGNINPFRYRGYYYDTESGLYYLQSRYYDPSVGQFISPDTQDYLAPETIGGVDLYAYGLNNPIMYVDPTGHLAGWVIALLYIGAGLLAAGTTLGYGAITEEPVVIDFSVSVPIVILPINIKGGISLVVDLKNKYIEFYPHLGGSFGLSSGLSFAVGSLENYEGEGDYSEWFVFFGTAWYHIGLDHCFDPTEPYEAAGKATSFTIGGVSYSAYFGWIIIGIFLRGQFDGRIETFLR